MRHHQLQFLLPLLFTLVFIFSSSANAKSTIEPCSSAGSCTSLLSYLVPYDSKVFDIAFRFRINLSDILAANSINPISSISLGNQILRAKTLVKVPFPCPCVDGIRRSISTTYAVQLTDTVNSISDGFGGLASAEQIRSVNGIDEKNPLDIGKSIVIPLPCTCFNNSNNGITSVYMSYVVQRGESLGKIAKEFGTTESNLAATNGRELGQPVTQPGDILAVPIAACSSAEEKLKWREESLIVPNGSYALTANNCIKCTCGPDVLKLRCSPSGFGASCSRLQCKGSDLYIGDAHVKRTPIGCNITACTYRGHHENKIFRSLLNSTNVACPGNKSKNDVISSAGAFPSSHDPMVPFVTLSPSPSLYPSSLDPTKTKSSESKHNPNSGNSIRGRLLVSHYIFRCLLHLLVLCYIQ